MAGNVIPKKKPKPPWLKRKVATDPAFGKLKKLLRTCGLHTVCEEAKCPNIWECYSRKTATFLIMGPFCTRNCRFCAVEHGKPSPPEADEALRVAQAVRDMNLRYAVITSVTRDDLPDGGAACFAETIQAIRRYVSGILIEVLIPDFQGNTEALKTVADAHPDVLNHNIETVPRLYPIVRPEARYEQSLDIFRFIKNHDPSVAIKSGLMLGLGETEAEVNETLADILKAGCRILTLGQYLQPSQRHFAVDRFVPPEDFEKWKQTALSMGFSAVASGPFVRSSYQAHATYQALKITS